jgi:NAD(P)-dependent dehydrogenase (short-subunit alcohol dehydrogenase family)
LKGVGTRDPTNQGAKIMTTKILITGSSGGFGRLIVERLLGDGHRVVASMRDPQGRNREVAEALRAAGADVLEIDVTDDDSVEAGVRRAVETLGGLDALVNNAGIGSVGLQESYTTDDYKRLFDVNVFGVQRMNRATIPHFRAQRRGLLVHVSSLLGRITIPFYGPYNSTKWALEAMAENYRTELSAFGIESVLVEPGGFATTFIDHLMRPSDGARNTQYGAMAGAPESALAGFESVLEANPQQDPRKVAEAVGDLVGMEAGTRPFRTVVDELGMGVPVHQYNEHLHELTRGIYTNFGTSEMLDVKLEARGAKG